VAKSNFDGTVKTFVSFRVTGDKLDPHEITEVLGIYPTLSYSEGEKYHLQHDKSPITGKTGVWYFGTEKIVYSNKMIDHLTFLIGILCPEGAAWGLLYPVSPTIRPIGHKVLVKLGRLHQVLNKRELHAAVTLFWHGGEGSRPPRVPRVISSLFGPIPIDIEQDFETEEGTRHVA
jgi:hypothetical protein